MSAKRVKSVTPKAHSDNDGVESRIKRMHELFKNADHELKSIETEYRSAKQAQDEASCHYRLAMWAVYEDLRALTNQYVHDQSKIPQRQELLSIDAKAKAILTMVSLLKSEMVMLTRKLKDAEHKEADLKIRLSSQIDVAKKVDKQLEIAEEILKEDFKQIQHEKNQAQDALQQARNRFNANLQEKNEEIAKLQKKNQDMLSKLDQRIKELESRNTKVLEKARKERDIAYEEGITQGYEKGMRETKEEISKMARSKDYEIEELKTKHKKVKDALDKTSTALQNEKEVTTRYSSQLKDAYKDIEQLRSANQIAPDPFMLEELQHKLAVQEKQFEQERSMFERDLQKLRSELVRAEERMKLTEEMPSKESSYERDMENINIEARPLKIADEYKSLMSGAWLNAKLALNKATRSKKDLPSADKVILLFDILMTCEREAKVMHAQILDEFSKALREPVQRLINDSTDEASGAAAPKTDFPENLLTIVEDYFKRFADTINLERLQQRTISSLNAHSKDHIALSLSSLLQIKDISNYLKESVRITWKMAIQRPQMIFEANQIGKPWKKESLTELNYGSNPTLPNAVVQYYRSPTLVHAGNTLVKGTVFVHSEKNPKYKI